MIRPRSAGGRAREANKRLAEEYPDARCTLDYENPFQLLVATILSSQTTDERVNIVTPSLFAAFPTPADLAEADPEKVEQLIRSTGFYHTKARNIIEMARAIRDRFRGEVQSSMKDLVTLAGVGRKTANVVRSHAFQLPGLAVDTHVGRLSRRLGLTESVDPVEIEQQLNKFIPASERGNFSIRLILHGRKVCLSRKPRCDQCVLSDFCPSAFRLQ